MSTVITNDEGERKEFKEKALQKVQALEASAVPADVEVVPVDVEVPSNFHALSDAELYGALKTQQLTPEQAGALVEQLRGRATGSREFRVILQAPVEQAATVDPVVKTPEYPKLDVAVPQGFKDLRIKDQFYYLINNQKLTIQAANDVMVAINGGTPLLFQVCLSEIAEAEIESVPFSAPELEVTLPAEFEDFDENYQISFLRTELRLSQKQAKDVVRAINGKPPEHFQITFKFDPYVEASRPEELVVNTEPEEFQTIEVELPEDFGSLRPQDQYLYLKGDMKFTADQANDIIFAFNNQTPLKYKVVLK